VEGMEEVTSPSKRKRDSELHEQADEPRYEKQLKEDARDDITEKQKERENKFNGENEKDKSSRSYLDDTDKRDNRDRRDSYDNKKDWRVKSDSTRASDSRRESRDNSDNHRRDRRDSYDNRDRRDNDRKDNDRKDERDHRDSRRESRDNSDNHRRESYENRDRRDTRDKRDIDRRDSYDNKDRRDDNQRNRREGERDNRDKRDDRDNRDRRGNERKDDRDRKDESERRNNTEKGDKDSKKPDDKESTEKKEELFINLRDIHKNGSAPDYEPTEWNLVRARDREHIRKTKLTLGLPAELEDELIETLEVEYRHAKAYSDSKYSRFKVEMKKDGVDLKIPDNVTYYKKNENNNDNNSNNNPNPNANVEVALGNVYKYNFVKNLGSGSFSNVFLAEDSQKNQFALKKLKMETTRAKKVYEREIETLNACKHVNIIELVELVVNNLGQKFLVLEYCEHNLRSLINGQALSQRESKQLILQLLNGLDQYDFLHLYYYCHILAV
jgi:hypothetical protein